MFKMFQEVLMYEGILYNVIVRCFTVHHVIANHLKKTIVEFPHESEFPDLVLKLG